MKPEITYKDFEKLDLRVAVIKSAEEIPDKDKLLKLEIQVADENRTLVAGIKSQYKVEDLIGKKIVIIANLKPRKLAGIESQGMLLAASDDEKISLLIPDKNISPGSTIS